METTSLILILLGIAVALLGIGNTILAKRVREIENELIKLKTPPNSVK